MSLIPVRPEHSFPLPPLLSYLSSHLTSSLISLLPPPPSSSSLLLPALPDPSSLSLFQFSGGQSNPTFLLLLPSTLLPSPSFSCSTSFPSSLPPPFYYIVLRKQPPGPLLPSAHRVDREFKLLTQLANSAVPVPPPILLCEDSSIIGTQFYLTGFVFGRIFRDPLLAELRPELRRNVWKEMAEVLAKIHQVRGEGGDGYLEKQVKIWGKQYKSEYK